MKTRLWIFALLVVAALGVHLALLSPRVAHVASEAMNARRAVATTGLRAQMDLIDARLAPRALAGAPELVDLLKAPTDVTQPMPRPDERALKAAMGAAVSEPDLLIVANPQGAIVQRKGKVPAQMMPAAQVGSLPLARAVLEGARPKPAFAVVDGVLFRLAGAALPQTSGAVVVGAQVDDALALRLRTQLDAEVTFFDGGRIAASSVSAEGRGALQEWIRHPSQGYGTLAVRLPSGLDQAFAGKLPLWTDRQAYRAALVSMDSGVQAAVSVPAAMYLSWLGRYQAFYLVALLGLVFFALLWGLVPAREPARAPRAEEPPRALEAPVRQPAEVPLLAATPDASRQVPADSLPWANAEEEPVGWDHLGQSRHHEDPALAGQAQAHEGAALSAALAPAHAEGAADSSSAPAEQLASEHDQAALASAFGPAAEGSGEPAQVSEAPALVEPSSEESAALAEAIGKGEPFAPAAEPDKRPGPEFSFAGLLDEAHEAASAHADHLAPPSTPAAPAPLFGDDGREATNPGAPSAALIAQTRGESFREFAQRKDEFAGEYFPGDEPTRIEPVSAALLDKLREMDDEHQSPRTVEHAPEKAKEAAQREAAALLEAAAQATAAAPVESAGPAEAHANPGDEDTDQFAKHSLPGELADPMVGSAAEAWPEQTAPQEVPSWATVPEHLEQAEPHDDPAPAAAPPEGHQPAEHHEAHPEAPPSTEPTHEEAAHAEPAPAETSAAEAAASPDAPAAEFAPAAAAGSSPSLDSAMAEARAPAEGKATPPEAQHVGDITLTNLQLPPALRPMIPPPSLAGDRDEPHWRDTFQRFLQARASTGEPSEKLSYEKFAAKLKKNREDLLARHACKGVRFSVYLKDGKAAIKASAIK